jgi:hypothetical protein
MRRSSSLVVSFASIVLVVVMTGVRARAADTITVLYDFIGNQYGYLPNVLAFRLWDMVYSKSSLKAVQLSVRQIASGPHEGSWL